MPTQSRTSIGMKFLLAIGVFSTAFSVFLVYETWKTSHRHLDQMIERETELALLFDDAMSRTGREVAARLQSDSSGTNGQAPATEQILEQAFDTVWQKHSHRLVRASGDRLEAILQECGLNGAAILQQLEATTPERVKREIRLNGQDYIAQFVLSDASPVVGDAAANLRMVAVPSKIFDTMIDEQTLSRFQMLMFGLLGLLAAVYGAYQVLIGRHLKRLAHHLKNTADQADEIHFDHLPIHSRDEIGLISDCYNQLCDKLQHLYQTLDSQVRTRTYELSQANSNLRNKVRECRHAEEQATVLAHEAMAANRAKTEFLANMSHEIRTPMNAIMGFSEILAESDLPDEPKSYVQLICNSSQMLLQLIKDILDFSKIESGKMLVEVQECRIGEVLGEIESMLRPQAIQKGIQFEILQCDVIPDVIRTDRIRLRQCLVNLVSNAIKFTAEGHVYVSLTLEEQADEFYLRFDVEDTGIGIAPEKVEMIFESFTQADSAMTRKYGGTGLGLAITKKLCGLMGGSITVKSEENKGSVFSIMIPTGIKFETKDGAVWNKYSIIDELNELSQAEKGMNMFNGKILVAEDNPSNQKLITILLQKMGLEVALADDGQSAVDKCSEASYDLILMDMQMPNMNGYEATRQLRSKGVSTPIIAVTANAMMGDEEKCLEAGCNGYISKPIDRTKLTEVIGQYLKAPVS